MEETTTVTINFKEPKGFIKKVKKPKYVFLHSIMWISIIPVILVISLNLGKVLAEGLFKLILWLDILNALETFFGWFMFY